MTFVHFGRYADAAAAERASSLESFKRFQAELKASQPAEPPKAEWLELVDSSPA